MVEVARVVCKEMAGGVVLILEVAVLLVALAAAEVVEVAVVQMAHKGLI